MTHYPFIFGSQYYRAPTPERECWASDLSHMREMGFNAVKLFVQWRWSHRGEERFYFEDLDDLMDLAHENGLGVTLNTLLDMSPLWLFDKYPDAKQVNASGQTIEPYAVSHRSIGGHPGPCYRHPGALQERQRFMAAVFDHFRDHPALAFWDVWNEPELSFQQRVPDLRTLVCYCSHCREGFLTWLQTKYGSIEHLDDVWGRCYETWGQVELPLYGGTIADFVDWREFHLDTLAEEAAWRLDLAKEHDPAHPCYLHVSPNMMTGFNSVTCVDDFAMAKKCDVWAASMFGTPVWTSQVVSAGWGKVCYNAESPLNYGSLAMHQRMLSLTDLLADFVPQIGAGIKGFLFWQYRPEILGAEAPAWGLVKLDGSDRPITKAVAAFWSTLAPYAEALMEAFPPVPEIGIWKSRKNEVFHFAVHGSLASLVANVEGYVNTLYWHSYPFRIVSEQMLSSGHLDGLKLLIMPSCYYLTEDEATSLDRWVREGGVLLCEAHLGGYNGTTGRHSRTVPGCRLAESWGLHEADSTSSQHLRLGKEHAFEGCIPEDVQKALRDFGASGARFFPIRLQDGSFAWGADRHAIIEGEGVASEGSFDGINTCIASKPIGGGMVLYCGTNLGEAASHGCDGLLVLLRKCALRAEIAPTLGLVPEIPGTVHLDLLSSEAGPAFIALLSQSDRPQRVEVQGEGIWRGLFSGERWVLDGQAAMEIPARISDLLVPEAAAQRRVA